jgi:hypothetical protein
MADDFNPINYLKEIGGVFKFGSGVLGKSAIAIGFLLCAVIVAVFRLHSDLAIFGVILIGAIFYFLWFFKVLSFADKHPDLALLDGAEWTSWKKFEAAAKGLTPSFEDRTPALSPATSDTKGRVLDVQTGSVTDTEQ